MASPRSRSGLGSALRCCCCSVGHIRHELDNKYHINHTLSGHAAGWALLYTVAAAVHERHMEQLVCKDRNICVYDRQVQTQLQPCLRYYAHKHTNERTNTQTHTHLLPLLLLRGRIRCSPSLRLLRSRSTCVLIVCTTASHLGLLCCSGCLWGGSVLGVVAVFSL